MKHEYLFNMARAASTGSKDPSTKVGCIISRKDGSIASAGYNGFPIHCDENFMTFEKPMKYMVIRHAERNAISFAKEDLHGYIMHVTHAPCYECLSEAVHNGIREIYYENNELFQKATKEANEAVVRLIFATKALVMNHSNGRSYVAELADMYGWDWVSSIADLRSKFETELLAKYCIDKSVWEIKTLGEKK
jgi:dCMP deaminase